MILNLGNEEEVTLIFESVEESDGGKGLACVSLFNFGESMLLHDDVRFLPQRVDLLLGADLEGEVDALVPLVLHLEDLREVPVPQLLHHLEVLPLEQLLVPLLDQSRDFRDAQLALGRRLLAAERLVRGPVLALAGDITVGD